MRDAKARGYLAHLPRYNSVFKYLESEALTPYLHELISLSAAPLKSIETDFAVDSSGFSTGQFTRWLDVKNSTKEDRRHWLKLHLMVGTKTNVVTFVEVSDGFEHDHRFKPLVDHTAKQGFNLKEVSADKGYLGADNLMTALRHGAIPYIPFKTNSVAQSGWGAEVAAMDAHVTFLRFESCRVSTALSKALERRNDVPHDQGEVWSTVAESDANGADKRGFV